REPLSTARIADIARQVTGTDYSWFFNQWINTVDLPDFSVEYIVYRLAKGGFQTVGKVNQTLTAFQIPLELKFVTKGQDELKVIDVKGESTRLNIETETRPIQLVIDPNFRILRKSEELEIQVHIVRGDEYFELGDFPSATDEYKRVLERQPRNSHALFKLALVFYEQFNYNTAQNTFREALNGDQQPPWVVALCYMYMGKIFDVLGQRQRAVAEYNKAVNTNDDSRGAVTEATKYLSQPFTRAKTYLPGQQDAAQPELKQPEEDKPDADAPAKDPGR
ncbi:MAG TPA: tetratricopeptide repeat protein, partial [Acidobacteriota bacterium]|nr:tetratricopeptide repeat protein [Acidobacteriota bacterium]